MPLWRPRTARPPEHFVVFGRKIPRTPIQEQIRERIVATNDMRLFSLLHLLGQASLRMEQALWPEDYERMTREVEEALRQATDANARSYTHEEVMQAMQERIDRARDKPC
ncbi:hypothetical protein ACMWKN_24175 [Enterobacter sp. 01-M-05-SI-ECC]|uniref:hypothetical protein n=1 Tax=Enterobacter sp. 01-M-05-SI-ECC TaxID=3397236 RepID=UPI0039E14EDB